MSANLAQSALPLHMRCRLLHTVRMVLAEDKLEEDRETDSNDSDQHDSRALAKNLP